jgi:malate permease and related proteins
MPESDLPLFIPVIQFVFIFILMASSAFWLRYKGVMSVEHSPVISRMITDVVLPALIFYKMSDVSLTRHQIDAAIAMIGSEVIVGISAWAIGRYLIGLNKYALGAFILASTFGSTSMMGTALIQIVFPDNAEALAAGIMVAQAGVGVPNNTIGVLIALWFGNHNEKIDFVKIFRTFMLNPAVIAFMGGLAWSYFSLPHTGLLLTVIFGALKFSGISLTFLVALLTGLTIKKMTRKDFGLPLIACSALLLIAEPIIAREIDAVTGIDETLTSTLLLLLGAMPASPLAIAFSVRYGCDVDLAAKLVVSTCVISVITLPLLAYIYS